MKTKREQRLHKSLPPVRVYVDDLTYIVDELTENCEGIEISYGKYDYDNVEEFRKDFKGETRDLSISAQKPYLSISFKKYNLWMYAGQSDIKSSGLFSKIENRLLECSPWPEFIYRSGYFIIAGISLNLFAWFGPYVVDKYVYVITIVGLGTIFGIWVVVTLTYIGRHCIVYAKTRDESPGFFRRNVDKIILLIIAAFVGSVLTLVVERLLK